jgi:hypothetical protein
MCQAEGAFPGLPSGPLGPPYPLTAGSRGTIRKPRFGIWLSVRLSPDPPGEGRENEVGEDLALVVALPCEQREECGSHRSIESLPGPKPIPPLQPSAAVFF